MSPQEIRDAIAASPEYQALLASDVSALAAALSAGRTKVVSTVGGYGTVVAVCGGATMNKLKAIAESGMSPDFTWGYQALLDRCFDFGLAKVIAGWDALTQLPAGALTQDEATALKAIPQVPDSVSVQDIHDAIGY